MTAIAYRDGVLAADTQDFYGSIRLGTSHKISARRDGAMAGAAGAAELCEQFLSAFRSGKGFPVEFEMPPQEDDEDSGMSAIVIESNGTVWFHMQHGPCKVSAPWHVLGSASEFLAGALASGASAQEAVKLATQFYMTCGGDVEFLRRGEPTHPQIVAGTSAHTSNTESTPNNTTTASPEPSQ